VNVNVPDTAVKSLPAVAVPDAVAYCTDTVDVDGADNVTGSTTTRDPALPSSTDAEPTLTTGRVVACTAGALTNETAQIKVAITTATNLRDAMRRLHTFPDPLHTTRQGREAASIAVSHGSVKLAAPMSPTPPSSPST
jgi:hypothetical protein